MCMATFPTSQGQISSNKQGVVVYCVCLWGGSSNASCLSTCKLCVFYHVQKPIESFTSGTRNSSISERVLQKCHLKLRKELNVPILLPYLNKYHLITADVHEELILQTTNATKVERLVAELPRMGDNFLDSFIKCLRDSVEEEPGTCHGQIANELEEELKHQTSPG